MMSKISLLLVDDHAIVRAGYRQLISTSEQICIVGESETAEDACQQYSLLKPNVVLMDLNLPGMSGLEAIRRITTNSQSAAIMVFSIHDELAYLERAFEAGAKGYLTKSCDPYLLIEGIQKLASGGTCIDPILLQKQQLRLLEQKDNTISISQLTQREFDIYCLLIKGKTTKEISESFFLSQKTVANYATQIKFKLGVRTIAEMSHLAQKHIF